VNDAVPLASGGDIVLLPQAKRFAELASYAWTSASATPPSFTACQVTVTKTVLVIVAVLSVQDMVAPDSPPYAAAGSAEASASEILRFAQDDKGETQDDMGIR